MCGAVGDVFRFLRFIVLLQFSIPPIPMVAEAESFLKQWGTGSRLLMVLKPE